MTAMMLAQSAAAAAGGGVELNLNAHTLSDGQVAVSATVGLLFGSNGQLSFIGNNNPPSPDPDEWVESQIGFSEGAFYEVAFTVLVSGDGPDTGLSVGVYGPLSGNLKWDMTAPGGDARLGVWRFRVREIADPANFVEADMNVSAVSTPV